MTTIDVPLKYTSTDEYIKPPHGFCPGCGAALAIRYFLKAIGDKVILVMPPGCTAPSVIRALEHNGEPIDTVGSPFGNVAFIAAGIKSGLIAKGDTETQVIGWAGDGATFDIGFSAVSAAAERNDDIIYVCYDNEAYQNTGNQRSSASPWRTINTTNPPGAPKMEFKKDIMTIMAAHVIPYAATATVGFPDDLMRKAQKAKSIKGFRFLHILTPCPSGWGFPAHLTLELSRLAVDTKVFPLFEVEDGVNFVINRQPKGIPPSKYTRPQQRFQYLTDEVLLEFERMTEQRWKRLLFLAGYKKKDAKRLR
jgi:pyruvate ferredoxin oxidoreductase beta subunit/2-oxoisovalerate ferredoxin oxidoreductase beta subunit